MPRKKDPAFLFFPADYIAGTMHMTFEEKGAYIEVLCNEFLSGGPLSMAKIKRICPKKKVLEGIVDKFLQNENGEFYNERLEEERQKRRSHCEKQSDNAKKRWL